MSSLLARESFEVNHKKLYRLYHEEGQSVRRRRSRKRALGTLVPDRANQRWSLDFVSDAFEDGQRFGCCASWMIVRGFGAGDVGTVINSVSVAI